MFTLICANPWCYNLVHLVSGILGIVPPEGWQIRVDTDQRITLYYCCQECKDNV